MASLSDKSGEEREMRLIDADALYEKFKNGKSDTVNEKDFNRLARYLIKHAPTVAAAPEVHGRWVKGTSCDTYWNYCSICGGKILKNEYQQDYFSDYCPFCGARMDGGE